MFQNSVQMKNIVLVFVFSIIAGIFPQSVSAQVESSSLNDCDSYLKIINGFDNAFEGLYNKATEEEYKGNYKYDMTSVPDVFEDGKVTLSSTKSAVKVFLSSDLISSSDEVDVYLRSIKICLTSNGFIYDGYEEYIDDYMGSAETEYYYYNSKLNIIVDESWTDDAMIYVTFSLNESQ